jgi:diguanylate cyclase (GGDEF)-like protein
MDGYTLEGSEDVEPVLAGVHRLNLLADGATEGEAIFRGLAAELISLLGADEVYVHHMSRTEAEPDVVAVYMFDGSGRLSYLVPRSERPSGVSWVASTGRSFLASGPRELAASVPRLAMEPQSRRSSAPAPRGESSALLVPLATRGEAEAVVALVRRHGGRFGEISIKRAITLIEQAGVALALVRARAEAGTDAVTGCMNHRAMRRRLTEEIGRAQRSHGSLACLLFDLDDFKQVNDIHGHPTGDAYLRAVADALMGEFRSFDRVARYGGDEFVAILPNADLESALAAGDRALARLRGVSVLDHLTGISASIGAAQWHPPMGTDELLGACDEALMRAKRDGKGRVSGSAA